MRWSDFVSVPQCSELGSFCLQLWDLQSVFLAFHLPSGFLTTLWIQLGSCSEWTSVCSANIWPGTEQLMNVAAEEVSGISAFVKNCLGTFAGSFWYFCWMMGTYIVQVLLLWTRVIDLKRKGLFKLGNLHWKWEPKVLVLTQRRACFPGVSVGRQGPLPISNDSWISSACGSDSPAVGGGSVKPSLHEWKVLAATATNLINLIAHFCLLCLAWVRFLMPFPVWGSDWWLSH